MNFIFLNSLLYVFVLLLRIVISSLDEIIIVGLPEFLLQFLLVVALILFSLLDVVQTEIIRDDIIVVAGTLRWFVKGMRFVTFSLEGTVRGDVKLFRRILIRYYVVIHLRGWVLVACSILPFGILFRKIVSL